MLDWHEVMIKTFNNQISIWIDGEEVFKTTYKDKLGELLGIRIHFEGNGAIDFVRINDHHGNSVLNDDFN